jgi:hypothetical protein
MDPQTALYEFLELLADYADDGLGDDRPTRDDIIWHLEDLLEWIRKGGFLPKAEYFDEDSYIARRHITVVKG